MSHARTTTAWAWPILLLTFAGVAQAQVEPTLPAPVNTNQGTTPPISPPPARNIAPPADSIPATSSSAALSPAPPSGDTSVAPSEKATPQPSASPVTTAPGAPTEPAPTAATASSPQPDSSARRQAPQDYKARAENIAPPTDSSGLTEPRGLEPEDYYLLLPRAALFLPNLALKIAFFPLRGLATAVDQYHLVAHTEDLLYNDDRTAAIYPAAAYQTGYGLSYGLGAFHSDVLGHNEKLSGQVRYGGLYQQAYKLSFEGDHVGGSPLWLDVNARWEVKPGLLFYGYGANTDSSTFPQAAETVGPRQSIRGTRHHETHSSVSATLGVTNGKLGSLSRAGINTAFHHRRFGPDEQGAAQPSIESVYDTSQLTGFNDGVEVLELSPTFIWDSRDNAVFASEGVYLDVFGGHTLPISGDANYWHYGATAASFVNLYKKSRVLAFRVTVEAVVGRTRNIPFSELIKLGGPDNLRGYREGRFRDKRAISGAIEYRYPIHELVAGELFLDAGTLGPTYERIFDAAERTQLLFDGGLGLVFHSADKTYFKLEAAMGRRFSIFISTDPLTAFSRRHKRL